MVGSCSLAGDQTQIALSFCLSSVCSLPSPCLPPFSFPSCLFPFSGLSGLQVEERMGDRLGGVHWRPDQDQAPAGPRSSQVVPGRSNRQQSHLCMEEWRKRAMRKMKRPLRIIQFSFLSRLSVRASHHLRRERSACRTWWCLMDLTAFPNKLIIHQQFLRTLLSHETFLPVQLMMLLTIRVS